MTSKPIHTVFADGSWRNKREESDGYLSQHGTKEEAVEAGRQQARSDQTEHMIHNQEGVIAERNSYGNDPRDRKG
jgi:uncharacterized protein DUF2188